MRPASSRAVDGVHTTSSCSAHVTLDVRFRPTRMPAMGRDRSYTNSGSRLSPEFPLAASAIHLTALRTGIRVPVP